MPIVLGVDIGTTSAKCLAVAEDGRALAFAQHPYPMDQPHEGWAEQHPEDYDEALVDVVRCCVAECQSQGRTSRDIGALALSTQADTLILTDDAGAPLRPAITWMDARGEEQYKQLLSDYGPEFWRRQLGQPLSTYSSACSLRWLAEHEPHLMRRKPRVAYVPDFLNHRLTGRWINDVPNASWSPFLMPASRGPSEAILTALGLSDEQMSPALESGEPIGEVLPERCAELGLVEGTLVIAGAFDQTAAAYGAGATVGGTSVLSCGTAWVLYAIASEPPASDGGDGFVLCTCCHVRANEWGIVLPYTGGSAYDWVVRTTAQGASASDASPLIFVPHLYGGLSPDWQDHSRGSLLGLTLSHTAEDIRLALMRGLAFETRRNIDAAASCAGRPAALRMVGGAAHSDVWPQMIADVVGVPVEVPDLTEAACYGAAKLAAGGAAGAWRPDVHGTMHVAVPNGVRGAAMSRLYDEYLSAYAWLTQHYRGERVPATEDRE